MTRNTRKGLLFQCPPLQGRWPEGPEGFPTHVSFRKGNKRVVTPSQGERKGRYDPWV